MDLNNLVSKIENFQLNPIVGIDFGFKNPKTQEVLSCISKGDSYVVVAGSGVGKTALCIDKFVNTPVEFCRKNNIKLHIDYFQLEETELRHELRTLSNIAYRQLNLEYSMSDFLNSKGKAPLINKTEELKKLQSFVDYYNKSVKVYSNLKSPALIGKKIIENLSAYKKQGIDVVNDKNFYYLVIVDNLKFLKQDNGHNSKKQAIDDLCLNILNTLRTQEGIIPVVLQHETEDNEDFVINVKGDIVENKLKPSLKKLGESRYTADPCTHVIGIFAPSFYGIDYYPKKVMINGNVENGYNINTLGNKFRMLCILKSRDGGGRTEIPFYFKGQVSSFEEILPVNELNKNLKLYDNYK